MKRFTRITAAALLFATLAVTTPAIAGGTPGTSKQTQICENYVDEYGNIYQYCYWSSSNGKIERGGGSYSDPWYSGVYSWMYNLVSGVYNSHSRNN